MRNYFGTTYTNGSGVSGSDRDTRPSKRRRITTPDPGSLAQPPPQPTPDLDGPLPPSILSINPDEILTGRWKGHDNGGDSGDDIDFEGQPIPQLVEVSDDDDEGSEPDLENWWGEGVAEDLLEVLEMNVELDACDAGVWCLETPCIIY
jgi:hypothetical protein